MAASIFAHRAADRGMCTSRRGSWVTTIKPPARRRSQADLAARAASAQKRHGSGVRCAGSRIRRATPLAQSKARRYDGPRLRYRAVAKTESASPTNSRSVARPTPDSLANVDLHRRIVSRQGEFLLFALTPPRLSISSEQAQEIADVTLERLEPLGLDGLILYDIDDESDRNPDERPFPFLPTMDPADYLDRHLQAWHTPVVVYRATAKYTEHDLRDWMRTQDTAGRMAVFVGASSQQKRVATTLRMAQQLRTEVNPDLLLGGVAIPERHTRKGAEHLRLVAKQEAGLLVLRHPDCLRRQRRQEPGVRLRLRVSRPRYRSGPDRVHRVGVWLDEDLGVPPMARHRRAALDRERPAPRQRHSRRVRRACRGNGVRADVLLPSPGRSVRDQRRIRIHPQAGDRGERAAGRPARHHAHALT